MDDVLAEAALLSEYEPDSVLLSTLGESIDNFEQPRAKRARMSGKTRHMRSASSVTPVQAISSPSDIDFASENGSKVTLEELGHKVSQLPEIMSSFTPVVK